MNKKSELRSDIQQIENILFHWSEVSKKYPIRLRNFETNEEMDGWKVVQNKLKKYKNGVSSIQYNRVIDKLDNLIFMCKIAMVLGVLMILQLLFVVVL